MIMYIPISYNNLKSLAMSRVLLTKMVEYANFLLSIKLIANKTFNMVSNDIYVAKIHVQNGI